MKKNGNILKSLLAVLALCAMLFALCPAAFATALSASRNTPSRSGEKVQLTMASNVLIYAGSIVCVDSTGKANPGADSSGFAVVGMAYRTVDNRTAVYDAAKTITVVRGVFRWENADTIVAADIGKLVYVTDDATVNKTGGGQNIIAGAVVDVDADGVWVDTGKIGPSGAATPSSLAVSGAATVGTTLTVTGASTLTGATTVTALLRANGGFNTDGGTFSVADTTGNTVVGGTLNVTGISTFTARPVFNAAYQVAPTNALVIGMPVTINGTNYVVGVHPVNQ